jgi:hypothetical protein
MYQKDYILRMIEMLGDLIAGIFGLIKKKKFDQASESLDRIYYDMLKQDATYFRDLPIEDITRRLLEDHNYTNGHLEILAELFYAEAELRLAKGNHQGCLDFSRKSLKLFEFVEKEYRTFSFDRSAKMKKLAERLGAE